MSKKVESSTSLIPRRTIIKEKLVSSAIKLFIAICLLVMTTCAWFIHNKDITVKQLSASTAAINQVQISLDNGITWLEKAEFDIEDNFILYREITSDGIEFYKPNAKESNGTPTNFIAANKNKDYLEYKVLFRSATPTTIYLEKKSSVYPAAGKNPVYLINSTEVVRESPNGNFSKDLIAGAVRIAFIENDKVDDNFTPQNTPKYIWAPNKGYQVRYENEKYVGYLDSFEPQEYTYTKVVDSNNFYVANLTNVVEEINASVESSSNGDDIAITTLDNTSENKDENIKAVTIRIWVEGNDREAIYSLKGGQFKINLSFLGLEKNL